MLGWRDSTRARSGCRPGAGEAATASPASVSNWPMVECSPTRFPWTAASAQQGAVEALVVGARSHGAPDHPLRVVTAPEAGEQVAGAHRRAHDHRFDSRLRAVEHGPVDVAQPAEQGTAHEAHGIDETPRVVGAAECGEPLDVGRHAGTEAKDGSTRQMDAAVPRFAEGAARVGRGRVHARRGHGPIGPQGGRPFGMAHAAAMKGQVHHELERRRAPEGVRGPAHRDGTQDGDIDLGAGHVGERSVGAEGVEPSLGTV